MNRIFHYFSLQPYLHSLRGVPSTFSTRAEIFAPFPQTMTRPPTSKLIPRLKTLVSWRTNPNWQRSVRRS